MALLLLYSEAALAKVPASDPLALVKRMESAYARTRDITANFIQVAHSKALGRRVEERGVLTLQRPGRMRWEYQVPDEKLFIAIGEDTYFYVPADNQVIEGSRSELREAGVSGLLLDGAPTFLENYEVSLARPDDGLSPVEGEEVLRLRPKGKAGYAYALVGVKLDDAIARRIVVVDLDGNSTEYIFDRLSVNAGVDAQLFEWTPPAGVERVRR